MRKNRLLVTGLLTAIGLLLAGIVRPGRSSGGMPYNTVLASKIRWTDRLDIVLAGNSRVQYGISPAAMGSQLPGMRIGNFAFSGSHLTPKYLAATRKTLDRDSKRRIVVIGISPGAVAEGEIDNEFARTSSMDRREAWKQLHLGRASEFFGPYNLGQDLPRLAGHRKGLYKTAYADGWVASDLVPENQRMWFFQAGPGQRTLAQARRAHQHLLSQVSAWTHDGIRVYGVRVPLNAELRRMEDIAFSFDEPAFVDQFSEAGGRWLSFDHSAYHTYDGSHLREDSARRFSRDLARTIESDVASQVQLRHPRGSMGRAAARGTTTERTGKGN